MASNTSAATTDDLMWKVLFDTVKGDTVIQTLMGGTASPFDARIYLYFNADAVVSTTQPAYMVYRLTASPRQRDGMDEPVFTVTIWAKSKTALDATRNRLVTLLEKRTRANTESKKVHIVKVHENDEYDLTSKFFGKTLHFQFGRVVMSEVQF